jgi:hypothetical protein
MDAGHTFSLEAKRAGLERLIAEETKTPIKRSAQPAIGLHAKYLSQIRLCRAKSRHLRNAIPCLDFARDKGDGVDPNRLA